MNPWLRWWPFWVVVGLLFVGSIADSWASRSLRTMDSEVVQHSGHGASRHQLATEALTERFEEMLRQAGGSDGDAAEAFAYSEAGIEGMIGPGYWVFDPDRPDPRPALERLGDAPKVLIDVADAKAFGAEPWRLWVWQAAGNGDSDAVVERSAAWAKAIDRSKAGPYWTTMAHVSRRLAVMATLTPPIWSDRALDRLIGVEAGLIDALDDARGALRDDLRSSSMPIPSRPMVTTVWDRRVVAEWNRTVMAEDPEFGLGKPMPPLGRPPSITHPILAGDMRSLGAVPGDLDLSITRLNAAEVVAARFGQAIDARRAWNFGELPDGPVRIAEVQSERLDWEAELGLPTRWVGGPLPLIRDDVAVAGDR